MARIELAPEVIDDFDRIVSHLVDSQFGNAADRVQDIVAAIDVLERNPLIGRPAGETGGIRRELVIGKGSRGYGALYTYAAAIDLVLVLAVRSQREAGYER